MTFELPEELKFISNSRLPQKCSDESMRGKTCLITGATSGVGRQAALRLADAGADILFIARNQDKAEGLSGELVSRSGGRADFFLADFADLKQVRQVAERILESCNRIDVLLNSAGVHYTRRTLTPAGHEMVFCVNHLAIFLVTAVLLPRLLESRSARIIQVNSEGHRFNGLDLKDLSWEKRIYTGLKAYGASKTAQLLTMWEFADLLDGTGVTINAMHPGAVVSGIGNNNGFLYRFYLHHLLRPFLKDPGISGEALFYLASSPELEGVSGRFFHLTHEEVPAPHARDRQLGREVFLKSLELTGVNYPEIGGEGV